VIHGDLHFHNMCLAEDGAIIGVFDVGDAHVDAAASEFHYVHSLGPRFVEGALAAYGTPLDILAIRRAHVRTALGHLQWVAPDAVRYPSILAWVTAVLDRLLPR
jgi:aminoglycoside phosphotransferase (APT) family kinase protein